MAYNTVQELKKKLLLESENQTISDADIQTYIDDANVEMFDNIKRTMERDEFISEKSGTVTFYPFFNVSIIRRVKVNDEIIDTSDYSISFDGDGVEVQNINVGDVVETFTIPINYKNLERAITIVNIRTRLNPFKNNTVDPIYNEWVLKRDNFKKALKSKFGVGLYNG